MVDLKAVMIDKKSGLDYEIMFQTFPEIDWQNREIYLNNIKFYEAKFINLIKNEKIKFDYFITPKPLSKKKLYAMPSGTPFNGYICTDQILVNKLNKWFTKYDVFNPKKQRVAWYLVPKFIFVEKPYVFYVKYNEDGTPIQTIYKPSIEQLIFKYGVILPIKEYLNSKFVLFAANSITGSLFSKEVIDIFVDAGCALGIENI
jgi:hypothetical protein